MLYQRLRRYVFFDEWTGLLAYCQFSFTSVQYIYKVNLVYVLTVLLFSPVKLILYFWVEQYVYFFQCVSHGTLLC